MLGFNGGLLGKRRVPTSTAATGLWFPNEQSVATRELIWPNVGDPYLSSVSLLLHMDGGNGSTTFTDSSTNALAVTAVGGAAISISAPKYGTGSLYFPGSSDLRVATNAGFGFGTGNFTIEFWLNYKGGAGYVFFVTNNSGSGNYVGYGLNNGTKNPWVWNNGDVLTASTAITNDVWQHHALVRNGSTLTIYLNGLSIGSTTWSVDLGTTRPLFVGSNGSLGQSTFGYMDDLRITKGVARYTANFTPPTAPFPDT